MKNKTLIRKLKERPELRKRLQKYRQQLRKYKILVYSSEEELDILSSVTEVYRGVALNIHKQTTRFVLRSVGDEIQRQVEMYKHQGNGLTWVIRIRSSLLDNGSSTLIGVNFKNKEDCLKASKDYIVKGELTVFSTLERIIV